MSDFLYFTSHVKINTELSRSFFFRQFLGGLNFLLFYYRGGINFPLLLQVFLAGLRIKLTWDWLTGERQTESQLPVYLGETQGKWVTCQNVWNPYLKCYLQLKQKRILWVVVWYFKGQEITSHECGKANVWLINVCWACRDNGMHSRLWSPGPVPPPHPAHIPCSYLWW